MATGSYGTPTHKETGNINTVSYTWTAAGGVVAQTKTEAATAGVPAIKGQIQRVLLIPDEGGTQPDDNYDATLLDDDGFDILDADGTDMSEDRPGDDLRQLTPVVFDGVPRLQVTNAGTTNAGLVRIIYLRGD